jgi:hypothetical protein
VYIACVLRGALRFIIKSLLLIKKNKKSTSIFNSISNYVLGNIIKMEYA